MVRLAAVDHVELVAFDGLGVLVDVAAECPFRGDSDDFRPSPLHPSDCPDLFEQSEDRRHVVWRNAGNFTKIGSGLGALVGLPGEMASDLPEDCQSLMLPS